MARLSLLERVARQRRGLILAGLLALAGCSHAASTPTGAPGDGVTVREDTSPEVQEGPERTPPPSPEPSQADRCGGYAVAMGPILGRVARATDKVAADMEAAPSRAAWRAALAEGARALAAEDPALAALATGIPAIDDAHARVRRVLSALARAFLALSTADGEASGKQAAQELKLALMEWDGALAALRAACPRVE